MGAWAAAVVDIACSFETVLRAAVTLQAYVPGFALKIPCAPLASGAVFYLVFFPEYIRHIEISQLSSCLANYDARST